MTQEGVSIPDRWEVGPCFAHHLASCTPLHPYVTLHFEMLLFHFLPIWTLKPHILMLEAQIQCKKCAKGVHTSRSADEAGKKGIPSVALQVPFLTTWECSGAFIADWGHRRQI